MNKTRAFSAIGILVAMNIGASADIAVPYYQPVEVCAKITNLTEFPDIVVVGYVRGRAFSPYRSEDRYIVTQNDCLQNNVKFGSLFLIWTTKHYADSVGLKDLPLPQFVSTVAVKPKDDTLQMFPSLHMLSNSVDANSRIKPRSETVKLEERFYKVVKVGSNLQLYHSKSILHFSDGTTKEDSFSPSSLARSRPKIELSPEEKGQFKRSVDSTFSPPHRNSTDHGIGAK